MDCGLLPMFVSKQKMAQIRFEWKGGCARCRRPAQGQVGDGDESPLSCRRLTICVTEFGAQGLELDSALLGWGTDFMLEGGSWSNARASGYKHRTLVRDAFQLRMNAYRVLLTRARDAKRLDKSGRALGSFIMGPNRLVPPRVTRHVSTPHHTGAQGVRHSNASEGVDRNLDGKLNDLPARALAFDGFDSNGVVKTKDIGACSTINCGRGAAFSQLNLRVSKTFALMGRANVEVIGDLFSCQFSAVSRFAASRIEAADRSMSCAVVDQFEIAIRMAGSFSQVVPPTQHTPSCCTRVMTAGVTFSPDRALIRTSTWFSTTSFRIVIPGCALSDSAI